MKKQVLTLTLGINFLIPSCIFSQFAYITNAFDSTFSVINTLTNKVVTTKPTTPLKNGPDGVVASPDGTKVYITYYGAINSRAISVINTSTNTIEKTIDLGPGYGGDGIDISPDGSKLYFSTYGLTALEDTVFVVNTSKYNVIAKIPVNSGAEGIVVSPDGSKVFVSSSDSIKVINTATNTVASTIKVPAISLEGLAISPDGNKVYATDLASNFIMVIDALKNSFITKIPNGAAKSAAGLVVSNDGSKMYVANIGDSTVSVINTATNTLSSTINVGKSPYGIAITPDGSKVYVAGTPVYVISTSTDMVIDTIRVGKFPVAFGKFISPYKALPVSLVNFSASQQDKDVAVHFNTSTELHISHFNLQHSTDGISFTTIGTVKAKGSGNYSFTDTKPTTGTNYYRLQSVDKDGTSSYSKIISVQLPIDNYQLKVYPNPAKDKVTITGTHISSVKVMDNLGRVVKVVSLKDATNPTFSLSSLPAGNYHFSVQTTDGKNRVTSLVKE